MAAERKLDSQTCAMMMAWIPSVRPLTRHLGGATTAVIAIDAAARTPPPPPRAFARRQYATVLATFGNGDCGRLGHGVLRSEVAPRWCDAFEPGVSDVLKVASGGAHPLVLTTSGDVYAMGDNTYGQLGHGTAGETVSRPARIEGPPAGAVVDIAAGHHHSACITSDGALWMAGRNHRGQLGDGRRAPTSLLAWATSASRGPAQFAPNAFLQRSGVRCAEVALGEEHTLMRTPDGAILAWGGGYFGQLGHGEPRNKSRWFRGARDLDEASPRVVRALSGVKAAAIAANFQRSAVVSDEGHVYVWGGNRSLPSSSGEGGGGKGGKGTRFVPRGEPESRYLPARVPGLAHVASVALGKDFALAW